jgi:hypothetical protein
MASNTPNDWTAAGFTPREAEQWVALGAEDAAEALEYVGGRPPFELPEAQEWKSVTDLDACAAREWRDHRWSPSEVLPWLAAWDGETDGECAREWQAAGFSPEDSILWCSVSVGDIARPDDARPYIDLGLTTDELRKWVCPETQTSSGEVSVEFQTDFQDLAEIIRWMAAGFDIDSARDWAENCDWNVDEAKEWRDASFRAVEARVWRSVCNDVKEAEDWRAAGFGVLAVRRFKARGIANAEQARVQDEEGAPNEQLYVLRPVAAISSHLSELFDAYIESRPRLNQSGALQASLQKVLGAPERKEALEFLGGEWDERAGVGEGRRMTDWLIGACENMYLTSTQVAATQQERMSMNTGALAESLATDSNLIAAVDRAIHVEDWNGLRGLVSDATMMIIQSASRAWTQTGKKIKIDQAVFVFRSFERRASSGPPQELWCHAIADALRGRASTPRHP